MRSSSRAAASPEPRCVGPKTSVWKCALTRSRCRLSCATNRPSPGPHREAPAAPAPSRRPAARGSARRSIPGDDSRPDADTDMRHRAPRPPPIGRSFWPASSDSAPSSLADVCSRGSLPPRISWNACTMNSISRIPPGPSLMLSSQLAALDLALDQLLHPAQRLEHAEVEVAAIDEGPQDVAVQLVEARGAGDRACLDVGVAFPVPSVLLQVVLQGSEADHQRSGFAEGPQPQVHAIDEPFVIVVPSICATRRPRRL